MDSRPTSAFPTAPPSAGAVTYRPSMALIMTTWRRSFVALSAVAVLVIAARIVYAFLEGGLLGGLGLTAIIVVVVGGLLGLWLLYLRTLSLTVDERGLTRRALGLTRRIPRASLRQAVLVSYTQRSRYTERDVPLVALLDGAGRVQLKLDLAVWAETDAQSIVSQLGLMPGVRTLGHRTQAQLRRELPGVLPWPYQHRVAFWFLCLGITVLMLAVIVAVVALTTG